MNTFEQEILKKSANPRPAQNRKLIKLIKIRQYMGKINVKSVTPPLKQHNVIIRGIFYQIVSNMYNL